MQTSDPRLAERLEQAAQHGTHPNSTGVAFCFISVADARQAAALLRTLPPAPAQGEERPTYAEVVESLADMVNQHAYHGEDGTLTDGALSSNEHAFDLLMRLGVMRQPDPRKHRFVIDWDAIADPAAPAPIPQEEVSRG